MDEIELVLREGEVLDEQLQQSDHVFRRLFVDRPEDGLEHAAVPAGDNRLGAGTGRERTDRN